MKILQVIESANGGSSRHLIDLALGVADQGHQVDVAYATHRMDKRFKNGLKLVEAKGGKTFPIEELVTKVGPQDFKAAAKLRRLLKTEGPYDIMHLHSSKAGGVGRLAKIGTKQKVVYTPHLLRTASPGLGWKGMLIYGTMERVLDRYSDATIYVSGWERDHAVEQRLNPAKMHVIPIGLPREEGGDHATLRALYGIKDDEVAFGFIGRLVEQKDPVNLVKAFVELGGSEHLLVVGDGPLVDECKAAANERVHFLGAASGPYWVPAFDVFVLASKSESFPSTLLEAGFNRKPCITTDCGACGEFVIDGESGFVIPIGDHAALTEAMRKLSGDKALRERMGEASEKRYEEYSYEKFIERTLALYKKVAGVS